MAIDSTPCAPGHSDVFDLLWHRHAGLTMASHPSQLHSITTATLLTNMCDSPSCPYSHVMLGYLRKPDDTMASMSENNTQQQHRHSRKRHPMGNHYDNRSIQSPEA